MTFYDGESFQKAKANVYHTIKLALEKRNLKIQQYYPEVIKITYVDQSSFHHASSLSIAEKTQGESNDFFAIKISLIIAACIFAVMILGIKAVETNKMNYQSYQNKRNRLERKKELHT